MSSNMDEIGVSITEVLFMFLGIMAVLQQMASATIFWESQWESCEWILADLRHCLTECFSCSDLPKCCVAEHKVLLFPYDPL